MRRWLLALLFLSSVTAGNAAAEPFLSLCFHNVQDVVSDPDGLSISTDRLVVTFSWLREHGFRVVSVDELLAAREGRRPLPPRAVLLTFDDGYTSFYNRVYPLLRAFDYPAVLALTGRWLDAAPGEEVPYGDRLVPREKFVTWEQVREMADSGLVEIASHSYDLHRGVPANPQGNRQPALSARIYDPQAGAYEEEGAWLARLRADLSANSALIERQTGRRPRVMVWPYGKFNRPALSLAREAGMSLTCGLGGGVNDTGDLSVVQRQLMDDDIALDAVVWQLYNPETREPQRVVHVDLDYLYDPDPGQQEANLGRLLDRIHELRINTVYLQAFADPDGDGVANALYVPNRHLPVRADLFNRAAWQLKTRAYVKVYAWMPVLAFAVGDEQMQVHAWNPQEGRIAPDPGAYRRLSPFSPEARRLIGEIYQDLAVHADFDGLLFHDDAFLTDYEDAGPAAMAACREAGLPDSVAELRADSVLMDRWTDLKTQALVHLTDELADRVRILRPEVKTARNLYALPVLEPRSETWFAQSLPAFLEHYDHPAVMAMPLMEGAKDAEAWLSRLVRQVAREPGGLDRTVFELQSVDWRRPGVPLPESTLARQMRLLQRAGGVNFGYYPDDFIAGRPRLAPFHGAMSLQNYPFRP